MPLKPLVWQMSGQCLNEAVNDAGCQTRRHLCIVRTSEHFPGQHQGYCRILQCWPNPIMSAFSSSSASPLYHVPFYPRYLHTAIVVVDPHRLRVDPILQAHTEITRLESRIFI